ncbi:tetratricopeptide repeat protein [Litchfieldella rifensis]|uniref:Tetratricopeptide repeat protein n=1 Tax=Litchfieldella rifensis TaxID=762643 RepID=A0ABV7LIF1_9GAMM
MLFIPMWASSGSPTQGALLVMRHCICVFLLLSCLALAACATPVQPTDESRLISLADDIAQRGDYATAAAMYERAAEVSGSSLDINVRLGKARLAGGDPQGAVSAFRAALASDIDNTEALLGLGSAQLQLGKTESAVRNLQKAVPEIDTLSAWSRLGVAHALLGQEQAAKDAFSQAVSLAPNDPDTLTNLALAQSLAGDNAEAVALMHDVTASPLAEERHFRNLILVLVMAGDTDQAASIDIPDMSSSLRQSLIEQARNIRDLPTPRDRAQAMGLAMAN